jgi:hypothetical protein
MFTTYLYVGIRIHMATRQYACKLRLGNNIYVLSHKFSFLYFKFKYDLLI